MEKSSKLIFLLMLISTLADTGLVLPTVSYYVLSLGGTAAAVGWLFTIYTTMQVFSSPVWGRIGDVVGRRRVLLVTTVANCVSTLLFAFAPTLTILYWSRVVAGLFNMTALTLFTAVVDTTSTNRRTQGMVEMAIAASLGTVVFGPVLSITLSRIQLNAPFILCFVLQVVSLFLIFAFFKDSNTKRVVSHPKQNDLRQQWHSIKGSLHDLRTRGSIVLNFLFGLGAAAALPCLPLFMRARFDFDEKSYGGLMLAIGLSALITQATVVTRLAKRWGELSLVALGSLISVASFSIILSTHNTPLVIFAFVLFGVSSGIVTPCLSSLVSLGVAPDLRNTALGIFRGSASLSFLMSPLFGWMYDKVDIRAPFLCAAASVLLVGVVGLIWRWTEGKPSQRVQQAA